MSLLGLLLLGVGVAYGLDYSNESQPVASGGTQQEVICHRQPETDPVTGELVLLEDYRGFIAEHKRTAEAGPLEVPVYSEDELLQVRQNYMTIYLGRDSGLCSQRSLRFDSFRKILAVYPNTAIRESADGSYIYAMYDTDLGGRLYLFFSKEKDYRFVDGFPVLMKNKLSYQDFASLKVGDGIEEVARVDSVADVYRRQSFDRLNDAAVENYTKRGTPPTSIHLLSDGILKIQYARDSTMGYVITDIVYSPDFVLQGFDGKTNYKIDEMDYVTPAQ